MEEEAKSTEDVPEMKKSNVAPVIKIVISVLALLAVGALAGYFLANNKISVSSKNDKISSTPTPTQAQTGLKSDSNTTTGTPTPTTSVSKKTVSAGLSGSSAFKTYTVQVPSGWTDAHETDSSAGIDKVTLTKGAYSLIIYQASFGGGGCIYGNEPDQAFAQKFSDYSDISGGQYRRSWNKSGGSTTGYTACQKNSDGSYGSPTQFGAISAKSPEPADAATMAEIDVMISSITKQ